MDRILLFILILSALYVISLGYISSVNDNYQRTVEGLADATTENAVDAMAKSEEVYTKIGASKEGFAEVDPDVLPRTNVDGQLFDQSSQSIQAGQAAYQKILSNKDIGNFVMVPAEIDLLNNIKISTQNQSGAQNKLVFGYDATGLANGSGEVYYDGNVLQLNGLGKNGQDRVVNVNDNLTVSKSVDAPLYRINGKNAFDFTADGALRIASRGDNQFKNVRMDADLNVNGKVVGNNLCIGNGNTCLNTSHYANIQTIPSLSSKLDSQNTTLTNAVNQAKTSIHNELNNSIKDIKDLVNSSGVSIAGPDLRFKPYGGRGEGGRALVHDLGNVLTVNYGNDYDHVDVQSSANIRNNLGIGGKIFFGDQKHRPWPDWGANGSDPYYIEKIGGNNQSSLRLTINDDADETFEIWGDSCRTTGCWGQGVRSHQFVASGDVYHRGVVRADGGIIIANKWRMSDTGDGWLRLYNTSNNWYWGGFAAWVMWSVAYYNGSDIRMKENIEKLDSETMLDKIKRIDGYKYNLKADQSKHYGLIAQYIQKEFPEMVKEDSEGMLGINYVEMVPVLLEVIKGLNHRIEKLEKSK